MLPQSAYLLEQWIIATLPTSEKTETLNLPPISMCELKAYSAPCQTRQKKAKSICDFVYQTTNSS